MHDASEAPGARRDEDPRVSRSVSSRRGGVAYGWQRAQKHVDTPDAETIEEQIVTTVLNEICEYFDFDDDAQAQ
jgi:hypothetical protein